MILTITARINKTFEKECNYGCYMDVQWDLKRKKNSNKIMYIYCYDIHNMFYFYFSLLIL